LLAAGCRTYLHGAVRRGYRVDIDGYRGRFVYAPAARQGVRVRTDGLRCQPSAGHTDRTLYRHEVGLGDALSYGGRIRRGDGGGYRLLPQTHPGAPAGKK